MIINVRAANSFEYKNRAISFFDKGKSVFEGLSFSVLMIYVMNKDLLQVALQARGLNLYFL